MRLHVSPTSPYARKVRIAVRELDLVGSVEEVLVDPWTDPALRLINPLSKVPVLVRDDGSVLFESLLLVEYLDAVAGGGRLLPPAGPARWDVLGRHALAQGLIDAAVAIVVERRRGDLAGGREAILRQEAAITASLARAESGAPPEADRFADIGDVALGCALGDLDLRHPALRWREDRPRLAGWFGRIASVPSFAGTAPPAG